MSYLSSAQHARSEVFAASAYRCPAGKRALSHAADSDWSAASLACEIAARVWSGAAGNDSAASHAWHRALAACDRMARS